MGARVGVGVCARGIVTVGIGVWEGWAQATSRSALEANRNWRREATPMTPSYLSLSGIWHLVLQRLTSGESGVICVPVHQVRLPGQPAQVHKIAVPQVWKIKEPSADILNQNASFDYGIDQQANLALHFPMGIPGLGGLFLDLGSTV
jgi:hypothetical protein